MNAEILVTVPAWLSEKLSTIAEICEESLDHVAAAFFAAEVVHTQATTSDSFCQSGGSHPPMH